MRSEQRLAVLLSVMLLAACSGDYTPSGEAGAKACDTAPVTLDLRSLLQAAPLATAEEFPTSSELAAVPYTYLLHVPESLPPRPVPLLVAIHGLGGSGPQFSGQSQWMRHADEEGFIVAFPTGPRKWDTTPGSHDVAFIRDVVAQLRGERCIDARRIWATGHSYGGYMTQRLACDAGDVFAAGASVSGGDINSPGIGGSCDAGATARPEGYEPVPLGFWHGTDDSVVRYDWGRTSLANWIERYQCGAPDEDTAAPYGPVEVYASCGRADVRARELASGTRVRLRFHTYTAHAHGYPDGCGGL
ncbi:MAG: alpha/beta hydrolase family esterase, partial [Gammaproteobacteria bacterium]